jgi:hypothetical protein
VAGQRRAIIVSFVVLPILILAGALAPLHTTSARELDIFGWLARGHWGYISVAITLSGYTIYIWQMYPALGESPAKPHPLSWCLFGFLTATGWVAQVAQGAQEGSWCLGVTAGFCFLIALISYVRFSNDWRRSWADGNNLRFDLVVTALALALFLGSLAVIGDPRLASAAALCATGADFISYWPTFKKAWSRPEEDSALNFGYNSIKCLPALLALGSYSIATTVYLAMLLVVNGFFSLFLLIRRRALAASF